MVAGIRLSPPPNFFGWLPVFEAAWDVVTHVAFATGLQVPE